MKNKYSIFNWSPVGRNRVIDHLRRQYPGKWRYDHEINRWIHESGRSVVPTARFAPQWDGDDDSFITEYRWSDTNERAL